MAIQEIERRDRLGSAERVSGQNRSGLAARNPAPLRDLTVRQFTQNFTQGIVSCVTSNRPAKPDWDRLFRAAESHDGHFTTREAADAGYSPALLCKYMVNGRVARVRRGVYRVVHFPTADHEALAVLWLWSEQAGVFSHLTALSLHGLTDALPVQTHLTLPCAWQRRRLRVPDRVVLHHADVPPGERTWFGSVPVTNARRTLADCARADVAPDLLRQGTQQALRRGLVTAREISEVERALAPFGGLEG